MCNHSRQDDADHVLLPAEPVAPLLQPTSADTLALCPTPEATKLAQKQEMKQKPLTQMYLDFGQVPRTTLVLLTVIRTANMVIKKDLHVCNHYSAVQASSSQRPGSVQNKKLLGQKYPNLGQKHPSPGP